MTTTVRIRTTGDVVVELIDKEGVLIDFIWSGAYHESEWLAVGSDTRLIERPATPTEALMRRRITVLESSMLVAKTKV